MVRLPRLSHEWFFTLTALRLQEKEQSELSERGLVKLDLEDERLTPAMRVLLSLDTPRQVKSVILSVPGTSQGKVLLNLIRHVLEIRDLNTAATVDLQRLQIISQFIAAVRSSQPNPSS